MERNPEPALGKVRRGEKEHHEKTKEIKVQFVHERQIWKANP